MQNNDMVGRVCLVTGANSGIGLVTARALASMGATVIMTARNAERGEPALEAVREASGSDNVRLMFADIASLASVRQLAEQVQREVGAVHVLVNNAGAIHAERKLTADGYELTFAVNHLGPFLLTHLLLDGMRESGAARVVNVTSAAHTMGRIDFDNLQSERKYSAIRAYGSAKLASILFTFELARRLDGSGVTSNCVHPGGVATRFASSWGGFIGWAMSAAAPFLRTPEKGAETSIYLASSPEVAGKSGAYFVDCRARRPSRAARDPQLAERLWETTEQLVGIDAN